MDMKQIKELMAAMEKGGMKKVRIKQEKGFEIELERQCEHVQSAVRHEPTPQFNPPPAAVLHPPHEQAKEKKEHPPGDYIASPMVGTFYVAASPDDPPYVKVGDQVDENTVLCIIEAMKVMNEVKAGKKGKIVEILISNADPVEFGTKLFRIES